MKTILFPLFLFFGTILFAQDTLYKKNGTLELVKVTTIDKDNVYYNIMFYRSESEYSIAKTELLHIVFKNGTKEIFNVEEKTVTKKQVKDPFFTPRKIVPVQIKQPLKDSVTMHKKKEARPAQGIQNSNVMFFNVFELLNSSLNVSYFKETLKNTIDIHVPVSISFDQPQFTNSMLNQNNNNQLILGNTYKITNYKFTRKNFDLGLGLYLNTSKNHAFTHFIGPLLRYAQYSGTYQSSKNGTLSSGQKGNIETQHEFKMTETSFLINNGFLFRINSDFNLMVNMAVGGFLDRSYIENDPSAITSDHSATLYNRQLAFLAGFHLGYRF